MKLRFLLSVALIAGTPLAASAQFTSVITPPKKEQAVVLAEQSAERRDSVQQVKLTGMKEWVDSAAASLTTRTTPVPVDSLTRTPAREPITAPVAVPEKVENAKSTRLPDTATPLPAVALFGVGLVTAGLLMMRKPRA